MTKTWLAHLTVLDVGYKDNDKGREEGGDDGGLGRLWADSDLKMQGLMRRLES